ncbi:MAG: hypothetical protein QME57_02990 [Patescibacteria group bacterium]|nr:hypothetical protein [Patescibacteria group bacterium]
MAKKIFDILPPKPLTTPPFFQKDEEKSFTFKRKVTPSLFFKKGLRTKRKVVWGLIPLVLIIVGIGIHSNLSRAEIEIWPKTELKSFETKLTVDKQAANIDFLANVIPGISFKEEKTFSQEFSASGKKLIEKKAEGIIRVFNDSQHEQILVAQTRFQPPLEKFRPSLETGENPWFRTTERIVIPAKGYKDVKVVAAAPGEKYNIEPSTFSVPGLAGSPQYTFVYGKSFESMKDGLKKETSEVIQEDLKKAEEFLKEKAAKEIKDAIINKIPPEFIVLEKAIKTEILETSPLAQAGAELEKFTFQVKAKAITISFKKEDLENFSKEFIISKIPTDKKIDQKSLKIEYLPDTINLETGKIVLSLNLESKIYSDIDKVSLKKGLSGKSLAEINFLLQNQLEINQSKVKLWPFWVKRVPENLEKIKIKEIID